MARSGPSDAMRAGPPRGQAADLLLPHHRRRTGERAGHGPGITVTVAIPGSVLPLVGPHGVVAVTVVVPGETPVTQRQLASAVAMPGLLLVHLASTPCSSRYPFGRYMSSPSHSLEPTPT